MESAVGKKNKNKKKSSLARRFTLNEIFSSHIFLVYQIDLFIFISKTALNIKAHFLKSYEAFCLRDCFGIYWIIGEMHNIQFFYIDWIAKYELLSILSQPLEF